MLDVSPSFLLAVEDELWESGTRSPAVHGKRPVPPVTGEDLLTFPATC